MNSNQLKNSRGKVYTILFSTLIFSNNVFAQAKTFDSLFTENKNVIYWMPTSTPGDLALNLNNYWIEMGYSRSLKNRNLLDFSFGIIVHTLETGKDLFNNINAIKSTGTKFNLEHKILFKRNFYYSNNIYYQQTTTIREETQNLGWPEEIPNQYTVKRNVFGLVPKFGFMHVTKWNIYSDIGIGAGIRYISSRSYNKMNESGNLGKEILTDKIFDTGNKFAQRIVLQFKIGYNF